MSAFTGAALRAGRAGRGCYPPASCSRPRSGPDITASAVIVHLSGGVVEAHFHFFVMVGVITLYQDWPAPTRSPGCPTGGCGRSNLVLKEAASAWRVEMRSTDLLARYGGEEFTLLLPACALEDAAAIVEQLRAATPLVTCSVGPAAWEFQEASTDLLARANQAVYLAKAEGRNHHVLAS